MENVDTANDLVLSQKGVLKCIKPRAKLQGRPEFITLQCTALFVRIQLKCLKKRRAQELTSHYGNCVHLSDLLLVLQGRVGAHELGLVGNIIYVMLQISSGMLVPKIMKIGS